LLVAIWIQTLNSRNVAFGNGIIVEVLETLLAEYVAATFEAVADGASLWL
jgi:hypothetical protein